MAGLVDAWDSSLAPAGRLALTVQERSDTEEAMPSTHPAEMQAFKYPPSPTERSDTDTLKLHQCVHHQSPNNHKTTASRPAPSGCPTVPADAYTRGG